MNMLAIRDDPRLAESVMACEPGACTRCDALERQITDIRSSFCEQLNNSCATSQTLADLQQLLRGANALFDHHRRFCHGAADQNGSNL